MTPCNADRSLDTLDWKVVAIARNDGPRSLNPKGPLARLKAGLLGIAPPLANERLEALRRFAVRAWTSDLIRRNDLQVLLDAGFSTGNARQILDHVSGCRGFTPTVEEYPPLS